MPPTVNNSSSFEWQNLDDAVTANNSELESIKSHLNLILLALEAIANISSEAILRAAKELNLESLIEHIKLWRIRSSNPKGNSREKKLDVEEARSLVIIICYLAHQHQELLRRAVGLLEQATEQKNPPHQTALLGNYLDKFINYYQERITNSPDVSPQYLSHLAWKLLIDLLFYSSPNGHRLLWIAIFNAARLSNES